MLTPRHITTSPTVVACDVCGRRLLRGEHSEVFLAGGDHRNVCELCVPRAVHEGWRREGAGEIDRPRRPHNGGRALLGRLRSRAGREFEPPQEEQEPPAERRMRDLVGPPPSLRQAAVDRATDRNSRRGTASAGPSGTASGGGYGASVTSSAHAVHAVPMSADGRLAHALELFNFSPHPRTVAGVARSLGAPLVSVRATSPGSTVVSIVVAWELSWYRYGVDVADETGGVVVMAQGNELDELEPIDRQPNAIADERGELAFGR